MRDRLCNDPPPSCGGQDCEGAPDAAWDKYDCGSGESKFHYI